jgi:S-formylglutathione hydrolase
MALDVVSRSRCFGGAQFKGRYASVSAFSPICSPMNCPWGQKALSGYLRSNKESWRRYDACALLEDGATISGGTRNG